MTRRTQDSTTPVTPSSLRPEPTGSAAHVPPVPLAAGPASTQELHMHLIPEQLARSHMEDRHRDAERWRLRRAALAARRAADAQRRAEEAERRARLAREAASLAAREASALAALR